MASGLYPGLGLKLPLASATAQEPVWASMGVADYTIPSGSSSVPIALNAGYNTTINVRFAAAPAGTAFSIMYDIAPTMTDEYALDTVAAVALQKLYTWSTNGAILLAGQIRITNSGGTNITAVYVQQTAVTA